MSIRVGVSFHELAPDDSVVGYRSQDRRTKYLPNALTTKLQARRLNLQRMARCYAVTS
jgi:hypothetical protein